MKNEYCKKRVHPKDQKSCLICGNPTVTVLFNPTGPDWLYTCDIHLKNNPQFVKPLYPQEYNTILQQLESLKRKITDASRNEEGMWDKWINKILKSKDDTTKQGSHSQNEKTSPDEPVPETNPQISSSPESLKKEYHSQLDRLANIENSNKNYALSSLVFDNRITRLKNIAAAQERRRVEQAAYTNTDPEQLLKTLSFPKVPTTISQSKQE